MLMVVIWTTGLDVPRHTTPEPERCGLCLQHAGSRTSLASWDCTGHPAPVFTCQRPLLLLLT